MKKWATLALLGASTFIIVIDTTIMNVSISQLVIDLNTTVGGVQSAISIYALVMASFILIGGKLADIIGKKRTFLIGVAIFGVGTTIASFSQSLGVLIFGWSLLEGLGSALMLPNIQTLLRDAYDGKDRAFAYAIISAVAAVGAAVGPIVGGYLTTYASWRWAFRLEVVIVVLVLAFSRAIRKDVAPDRRPQFDYVGAALNAVGWAAIVLGILLGGEYGFWTAKQPFVIGGLSLMPFGLSVVPFMVGFGVLLILGLFLWERRLEQTGGDGLFRPSLFAVAGLPAGFAVRFIQMAIMAAFLFTFPLLLQIHGHRVRPGPAAVFHHHTRGGRPRFAAVGPLHGQTPHPDRLRHRRPGSGDTGGHHRREHRPGRSGRQRTFRRRSGADRLANPQPDHLVGGVGRRGRDGRAERHVRATGQRPGGGPGRHDDARRAERQPGTRAGRRRDDPAQRAGGASGGRR